VKIFSFPSFRLPRPKLPMMNIMTILPTFGTRLRFAGGRATIGALAIVAIGFTATIWLTYAGTTDEIIWPEPGAAYQLPNTVGERLAPDLITPMTRSQTLQINLANGARLDKLHLKNLDLGKTGLATSFSVDRTLGVTGAFVNVGQLTITNSSAPTLDWANMQIGSATIAAYVDGHTQAMVLDNTIPQVIIDSDRGAGTYVAEDSRVDRVVINTNGDSGAYIGELIIDNVDASVGAWDWDYLKVGVLSLDNTNKFGNGTGINSASAVFNNSISARSITDNLVDTPLSVQ
jgi:hypothetical protein